MKQQPLVTIDVVKPSTPNQAVDEIVAEIADLTRLIANVTLEIKELIRQEIELARKRGEKERELAAYKIEYGKATRELMDEH